MMCVQKPLSCPAHHLQHVMHAPCHPSLRHMLTLCDANNARSQCHCSAYLYVDGVPFVFCLFLAVASDEDDPCDK